MSFFLPEISSEQAEIKALSQLAISEVKKGLYSAEAISPSGEKFYLGYEKITSREQIAFWEQYKKTLQQNGGGYSFFAQLLDDVEKNQLPTFPQSYSAGFASEDAYIQAVQNIRNINKIYRYSSILIDIARLAIPFFTVEMSSGENAHYVVYASKIPIEDFRYKKPEHTTILNDNIHAVLAQRNDNLGKNYRVKNLSEVLDFLRNYGDIIMCYGSHTRPDSPSITHMGIFRSPISFLDSTEKYNAISLVMHGFGAQIAHHVFKKEFLVFAPIYRMLKILFKSIDESECVMSSQADWKERLRQHFANKHIPFPDNLKSLNALFHYEELFRCELILLDLDRLEPFYHNPNLDAAIQDKSRVRP